MIQAANVDKCERIRKTLGDQLIGLAWGALATGVVVHKHHACAPVLEGFLDDLAGVARTAVDGPAEKLHDSDQAVTVVQLA